MNQAILELLASHRQPLITQTFVVLSVLTWPIFYIAYAFVLGAFFRGRAWCLPVISLATEATSFLLKRTFAVPRPELFWQVVPEYNYAFPSGHTMAATAFATGITLVFGWRWGVPAWLLAVTVAFARLYLGVHWFTDIIGGFIFGPLVAVGVWVCAIKIVGNQVVKS